MKKAKLDAARKALNDLGFTRSDEFPGYIKVGDRHTHVRDGAIIGRAFREISQPHCYAWKHGRQDSCCQWRFRNSYVWVNVLDNSSRNVEMTWSEFVRAVAELI